MPRVIIDATRRWERARVTPVSNDALAAGIAAVGDDIRELRDTILRQNGRIGKIELERAEERGARDAVAQAAAQTAAALALKDKSRSWKIGVIVASGATLGALVTAADFFAHYLLHLT